MTQNEITFDAPAETPSNDERYESVDGLLAPKIRAAINPTMDERLLLASAGIAKNCPDGDPVMLAGVAMDARMVPMSSDDDGLLSTLIATFQTEGAVHCTRCDTPFPVGGKRPSSVKELIGNYSVDRCPCWCY